MVITPINRAFICPRCGGAIRFSEYPCREHRCRLPLKLRRRKGRHSKRVAK